MSNLSEISDGLWGTLTSNRHMKNEYGLSKLLKLCAVKHTYSLLTKMYLVFYSACNSSHLCLNKYKHMRG